MTDDATPVAVAVEGSGSVTPPPAAKPDAAAPAPSPARPPLKLVVLLQPEGDGFRALLSLGREGCDPELRSARVDDLAAALDEVPALLAEAEARWASQPRFPSAAKPRASAGAVRTSPTPPPSSPTAAAPPTPARPPASGQLGLFR